MKQILLVLMGALALGYKHARPSTSPSTASNLRNLLLLTDKDNVENLCKDDIRKLKYSKIDCNDVWKVKMINEITDTKFDKLDVENFTPEELEVILVHLCTS